MGALSTLCGDASRLCKIASYLSTTKPTYFESLVTTSRMRGAGGLIPKSCTPRTYLFLGRHHSREKCVARAAAALRPARWISNVRAAVLPPIDALDTLRAFEATRSMGPIVVPVDWAARLSERSSLRRRLRLSIFNRGDIRPSSFMPSADVTWV